MRVTAEDEREEEEEEEKEEENARDRPPPPRPPDGGQAVGVSRLAEEVSIIDSKFERNVDIANRSSSVSVDLNISPVISRRTHHDPNLAAVGERDAEVRARARALRHTIAHGFTHRPPGRSAAAPRAGARREKNQHSTARSPASRARTGVKNTQHRSFACATVIYWSQARDEQQHRSRSLTCGTVTSSRCFCARGTGVAATWGTWCGCCVAGVTSAARTVPARPTRCGGDVEHAVLTPAANAARHTASGERRKQKRRAATRLHFLLLVAAVAPLLLRLHRRLRLRLARGTDRDRVLGEEGAKDWASRRRHGRRRAARMIRASETQEQQWRQPPPGL